ncbi:MAG: hypothetical protein JWQ66_4043 [Mucilaginibacter sp.]|nr:hypothetical protein [Mucilaginibacter sp.]
MFQDRPLIHQNEGINWFATQELKDEKDLRAKI